MGTSKASVQGSMEQLIHAKNKALSETDVALEDLGVRNAARTAEKTPEKTLLLDALKLDTETQSRVSIDAAVVQEYAEAMIAGAKFPSIVVFFDESNYWLSDGWHRTLAAKKAGLDRILAEVRTGGKREAILHSVGANATHGLRRTNEDKRKAVLMLFADQQWNQMSDGLIAAHCGVSQPFVSKLRTHNGYESSTRKGADGRQIDVSQIGGKAPGRAPATPQDDPAPAATAAPPAAPPERLSSPSSDRAPLESHRRETFTDPLPKPRSQRELLLDALVSTKETLSPAERVGFDIALEKLRELLNGPFSSLL